jgi:hypothetical protein
MIDIDDFKEQILPRLIVAVALTPAFLLVWWFLKMMNEPTPQEIWQQRADSLTVLSSDSEILSAISGEPRRYLIKNYKFDHGVTVKDTIFDLLKGEYMAIDIHHQVFTTRGHGKNKIELTEDHPLFAVVGKFAFNDTIEIKNADSLKFAFSSKKYWENLTPENVNPQKLGHVQYNMYYYPEWTMNLDSIENIFKELPDRFHAKTQQTLKQLGQYRKEYESCFTLTFMKKDDNATFAAVLGGGAADFNVFDDGKNFMLVDCDNISQCSSYESNFNLGMTIGFIIAGLAALCVIIFAPQILNKD